jgi:hypothetical protein
VLGRRLLEVRELRPAGPAPRGPLVDHDGIAAEVLELVLERLGPSVDQLVGSLVERRELRRSVGECLLIVRRRRGVVPIVAPARDHGDHRGQADHREREADGDAAKARSGLGRHLRELRGVVV